MREEEMNRQNEAPQPQQEAPQPEAKEPAAEPQPEEAAGTSQEAAGEKAEEEKRSRFGRKAKDDKQIEALKAKLDDAEKKAAELKDRLLRTAAEYDNFRKRSAREQDAAFGNGLSWAVEQILPILDTLEMAAAAPCADENYKKGVEMTLSKAADALAKLKVEEIQAQDQPFDPNLMSAVQQVPAQEGQESGAVVQVYQKGYRLGDKVIRHATVVVAE